MQQIKQPDLEIVNKQQTQEQEQSAQPLENKQHVSNEVPSPQLNISQKENNKEQIAQQAINTLIDLQTETIQSDSNFAMGPNDDQNLKPQSKQLNLQNRTQQQSLNPISEQKNQASPNSPLNEPKQSSDLSEQEQSSKQGTKISKRLARFKQKHKQTIKKKQQQAVPNQQSLIHQVLETLPLRSNQSKFIKPVVQQQNPIIQQSNFDEYKMLEMMIQSKKKQNYVCLKQWDDKRVAELALHLSLVEGFQRCLDRVARTSFQNVEIYLSTFQSIFNQQLKSAEYYTVDIVGLTQKNDLSQNVYLTCSCILDALNEQNMERSTKARKFSDHINTHILKNTLDPHIKKSQQSVNAIKTLISKLRSSMISIDALIDTKIQKLTKMFYSKVPQFETHKKDDQNHSKDLFSSQIQFLRLVNKLYQFHQQYANKVLQYFEIVKTMEVQRIEIIKRSIRIYCQGQQQIYQSQTAKESLELLSKPQEIKLIDEFYKFEELLPTKLQLLFRQKTGTNQKFTLDLFLNYLKQFKFSWLDIRRLLLKQYPVASSVSKLQKLTFLITVDKFIHIIDSDQQYGIPILILKIDHLLGVKRKKNQIEFEKLPQNKGGVLGILGWKNKSPEGSSIVFFETKDKAEEAEDYIKKLM